MHWIDTLTQPESTRIILGILLDTVLKGALILALAGVVTALLRRASAATRHLVWSLALGSLLVLPALSLLLPSWQVLHLPEMPFRIEQVTPAVPELLKVPRFTDTPVTAQEEGSAATPAQAATEPVAHEPTAEAAPLPAETVVAEPTPTQSVWAAFQSLFAAMMRAHWSVWLLTVWLGGIAVCCLRFLMGGIGVRLLLRGARPIHDVAWLDLADELGDRLYLRRHVRLLRSPRTAMPMTWGFWRPVVLLPSSADEWSETRRRCVLLHEFAHIKRADCLTQAFAQLTCALHWFNPLAWVAARQMRVEREVACDDYVLNGGTRPSDYATHLIEIARSTHVTFVSPLSAVSMARPSQLEGRVLSILDPKRRRRTLGRATWLIASGLTAAMVLPIAALQPSGDEAEEAPAVETQEIAPVVEEIPVPVDPTYEAGPRSTAPNRSSTFTWAGKVKSNDQVNIYALQGDIRVEPTDGKFVEVVAKDPGGARIPDVQVHQYGGQLVVCVPGAKVAPCADLPNDASAEVDFLVRLPQEVHLTARTVQGNIDAKGHTGVINAEAVVGDIDVETAAYAEAHAIQGDVRAVMGTTSWTGTLSVKAEQGVVHVSLPGDASVEVTAKARRGRITAPRGFEEEAWDEGGAQWGVLGSGGRSLLVYATEGSVRVDTEGPGQGMAATAEAEPTPPDSAAPEASRQRTSHQQEEARRAEREWREVQRAQQWAQRRTYQRSTVATPASPPTPSAVRVRVGDVDVQVNPALISRFADWAEDADFDVNVDSEEVQHLIGSALAWATDRASWQASDSYARQFQSLGLDDADGETLAFAQALEIDRAFARAAQSVRCDISLEKIIQLRLVGVNESFLRDLRAAGYEDLEVGEIIALQMGGVEGAYLQALATLGYDELYPDEIIRLYHQGVDADFIREMAAAGYRELCPDELIQLHQHGIDKAFVKKHRTRDRDPLPVEEMVHAKVAEQHRAVTYSSSSSR